MKYIIALLITGSLIFGGWYYWRNFRGALPAFLPYPTPRTTSSAAPGQNSTHFPLTLAPGMSIEVVASDLEKPRDLAVDPNGTVYVVDMGSGNILTLPDKKIVLSQLKQPHSIVFDCSERCVLYVAESNAVSMYDFDLEGMTATNRRKLLDLPDNGRHFTKTLALHPDGKRLLISVGSSCDTCVEANPQRGSVLQLNKETQEITPYASGLRNSVFLTSHPSRSEVWATEMGRDFLGDNLPPDEVNILIEGNHYGWPYCYGNRVHDSSFDKSGAKKAFCETTTPAHIELPAHSAPLGLTFIPTEGWPSEYAGNLLVAMHGSWNRSTPTGYKIVRIAVDEQGNPGNITDFISGWLEDNTAAGRPADVLALPGGQLYISDDKAGLVYKATYHD